MSRGRFDMTETAELVMPPKMVNAYYPNQPIPNTPQVGAHMPSSTMATTNAGSPGAFGTSSLATGPGATTTNDETLRARSQLPNHISSLNTIQGRDSNNNNNITNLSPHLSQLNSTKIADSAQNRGIVDGIMGEPSRNSNFIQTNYVAPQMPIPPPSCSNTKYKHFNSPSNEMGPKVFNKSRLPPSPPPAVPNHMSYNGSVNPQPHKSSHNPVIVQKAFLPAPSMTQRPQTPRVPVQATQGAQNHPPPPGMQGNLNPNTMPHPMELPRSPNGSARVQDPITNKDRSMRRRQLGQWVLGRTVGAGSTGKVKMVTNIVTGEIAALKIMTRTPPEPPGQKLGANATPGPGAAATAAISNEQYKHQLKSDPGAVPLAPQSQRHNAQRQNHHHQQQQQNVDKNKDIRVIREAALCVLLKHPHICEMKEVFTTEHHYYMVLEYIGGGQMLDYIISHGKLKEKQARFFARQIASALAYLHMNSIVHRDLKIENILISREGNIKIIDFGLSNFYARDRQLKTFCGSLYFAAPELLSARPYVGPEIDVWSFGIVLYVLVCGKVPFDDQNMQALHQKIKQGIIEFPPWLSSECKSLLSRMIVVNAYRRASLAEVINHPWMNKGFDGPPNTYLPPRLPIMVPLNEKIVDGMTGLQLGSKQEIKAKLEKLLTSEGYQQAVRHFKADQTIQALNLPTNVNNSPSYFEKKLQFFDNLIPRRSTSSASNDALPRQLGYHDAPRTDGIIPSEDFQSFSAYHPYISIYYLVQEKQARDWMDNLSIPARISTDSKRIAPNSQAAKSKTIIPSSIDISNLSGSASNSEHNITQMNNNNRPMSSSQQAKTTTGNTVTNSTISDMHEKPNSMPFHSIPSNRPFTAEPLSALPEAEPPSLKCPPQQQHLNEEKKHLGLFRRLSSRKPKDRSSASSTNNTTPKSSNLSPPQVDKTATLITSKVRNVGLQEPETIKVAELNKTIETTRNVDGSKKAAFGFSGSEANSDFAQSIMTGSKDLKENVRGLDNALNSTPMREQNNGMGDEETILAPGKMAFPDRVSRAKTMGHVQAKAKIDRFNRKSIVNDEDSVSKVEKSPNSKVKEKDFIRPTFLRGLFSSQTTSTLPPQKIIAEIHRVLDDLKIGRRELNGRFFCVYRENIDKKATEKYNLKLNKKPPTCEIEEEDALYDDDDDDDDEDSDYNDISNYDDNAQINKSRDSNISTPSSRASVLKFEILIVKVSLLQLHGVQFKRISGDSWKYKTLANNIVSQLRI